MILGIGIDLVEIQRIIKLCNEKFIKRILSSKEQTIFFNITNKSKQYEFLAGRFSAKEAIFKAYKKSDEKNHNFNEISILNNEDGSPYVELQHDLNVECLISITHTDNYASSICILQKKG